MLQAASLFVRFDVCSLTHILTGTHTTLDDFETQRILIHNTEPLRDSPEIVRTS